MSTSSADAVSSAEPADPCAEAGAAGIALGCAAPDFELPDQFGQTVRLSSFRDRKAVAVVFLPFAFSGVCTGELSQMQRRAAELLTFDTEVLVVSCDPMYSLRAFADRDGLTVPLLSDFWPHGRVTAAYGVLDERRGAPLRSSFVVDRRGVLRWETHQQTGRSRDLEPLVGALRDAAEA